MDKELVNLLQLLSNRTFVSAKELEEKTNASKRQINYRLTKINDLLQARHVPTLSLGYQKDIIILPETKQIMLQLIQSQLHGKVYYLRKEERLSYIYLTMFLCMDYLSLNDFVDNLQVSRSTVLSDIKELVALLEPYQIRIKNDRTYGYYLTGSEMEIRKYMMRDILVSVANGENKYVFNNMIETYHLEKFSTLKATITKLSLKHRITFVEDRLVEFIYIFIFLKTRMLATCNKNFEITVITNTSAMQDMKEYQFSAELLFQTERGDQLSSKDITYIAAWILGISIGDVKEETHDSQIICNLVKKLLYRFESLSGFHYRDYTDIFQQLYSHVRPAYYRLLFHLPINNPLCERIKEEYGELYRLVSESMKPFVPTFQEAIPEDELAYLTVHFAAIFTNEREGTLLTKKTALVVCSNGIGSSAILHSELSFMFPDLHFLLPIEARKIIDVKECVDIIFTTNMVEELVDIQTPVMRVHPVMSAKEKYHLTREVYRHMGNTLLRQPHVEDIMQMVMKHTDLKQEKDLREQLTSYFYQFEAMKNKEEEQCVHLCDIIDTSLVSLNVPAKNMEQAIRNCAKSLLTQGYVKQSYIDAMVEKAGAYVVITTHVALPHARPETGALKIGISINTLEEAIVFGNQENDPVKYIFCLSAIDNESHIHAMAELLDILERKDFYQMLDDAQHAQEVIEYIHQQIH